MSADNPADSPAIPDSNPSKPPKPIAKRRVHFKTGQKRERAKRTADVIDATVIARKSLNTRSKKSAPKVIQVSSSRDDHSSPSSHTRGALIAHARAAFQRHAATYVAKHIESVERSAALVHVDPRYADVARRGAEWALTNISAEENGKTERIISKAESAATAPTIQIGIALGGLPASERKRLTDGTNE